MGIADTPYNKLAFKASHNSYDRDEDLHEQLLWDPAQPHQGGCRGLEIDITRHSDSSGGTSIEYFQVSHSQGGSGRPLADYLGHLLAWHLADPGHDPIFLDLDIKSEDGDHTTFPGEIDTYLREWFHAPLLFTPGHVVGKSGLELVYYLQRSPWPRLADLKGKFIFCLSGFDKWKSYYAETSPTTRLCFADFDVDDTEGDSPVQSGWRAIANVHLWSDHHDKWKELIPRLRSNAFIVRGYVLNADGIWEKALDAGINVLATDKVRNSPWARVGNEPFVESPV